MWSQLIAAWQGKRILIVGDVMLDRYIYGQVKRISPEAPIPILKFDSEKSMLGGAGNVARNIVSLGGKAILVGIVGDDDPGKFLTNSMAVSEGIDCNFIKLPTHVTTVKTRFVSGAHQMMRMDSEEQINIELDQSSQIVEICMNFIRDVDAIVLSDYAKGVLSAPLSRRIIALASEHNIPVLVDPKSSIVSQYAGAAVLTPNASEAENIIGYSCKTDAAAAKASREICELGGIHAVVLTRGGQGMTIWSPDLKSRSALHLPTEASEVFDVSGAGDTVIATLALALVGGADVANGAAIANMAAGIAVGRQGTAAVKAEELFAKCTDFGQSFLVKIRDLKSAAEIIDEWKSKGFKIGFTNGCFDLLHPGHVRLLFRAKSTCDRLIVAINSDDSVRTLKGPSRPIQNAQARAEVIAAMECTDIVVVFDELTPLTLIEELMPDVLIKGGDYDIEQVVGAESVASRGGHTVIVPYQSGNSTTSIIDRIAHKGA